MAAPVLTASLLTQLARITARLIARAYLQRVLEEAARVEVRVEEITDPVASRVAERHRDVVHDLRVALRRLRSWLRVWRPVLGDTVRKSSERRLQRLSRLAGRARDLEVQRTWLITRRAQRSRLSGESDQWMAERIEIEYSRALRTLSTTLLKKLGHAAAALDSELQEQDAENAVHTPEPIMASMMADFLEEHAKELPHLLRRIRRAGQVDEAHAARIAIKRFRYLSDSLGRRSPDVRLVTGYLTILQDRLGGLHDAQILAARLTEMSGKARESRRSQRRRSVPRPADLSVLRLLLSRRITREFLVVRRTIDGPGLARAVAATERVIARLNRLDKVESARIIERRSGFPTPHCGGNNEAL